MKQRKPRKATHKRINQLLEKQGTHCPYDDGTVFKECGLRWADKCDGNRMKCKKLMYHHIASITEKERLREIHKGQFA